MEGTFSQWRQVAVWVPAAFVALAAAGVVLGLGSVLPDVAIVLILAVMGLAGAAAFSWWIFRVLEQSNRAVERRSRQMTAVNEASLALTSDLDLPAVLQRVVDLSREVVDARYGALALVDTAGEISHFLTSGLGAEERAAIGPYPEGKGLLGAVIRGGEIIRVERIAEHPSTSGFPPNHPVMTSFIGLPIAYEGRILGDLYLTDKEGGLPFSDDDEAVLRTFASHAAVAIENARLYSQVQDLAVVEERDRISMDLHDGVIQSLYATGLRLENCLDDLPAGADLARGQVEQAIDGLNQAIGEIRGYILHLRPALLSETDLAGAIGGLLQELKAHTLMQVELEEERGASDLLTDSQTNELFHVAREMLTNVRRHARASKVTARLEQRDGTFRMVISDDGLGFDPRTRSGGQGLRNMNERVATLNGRLDICASAGKGTTLLVEIPLEEGAAHA